nr:Transposon Ty3-G Gag-Pol polyprotein [Ipomoea batatas]
MAECRTAYRGNPRPSPIPEEYRWQPRGSSFSQVIIRPALASQPSGILSGGTSGQIFLPVPHALPTPALPIRKFTAVEIRDWLDKGLCFHCDQKYSQGHRCKGRFLLLIGDEEEPDMDAELVVGEEDPTNVEFIDGDVSMLNTMTGSGNPRSLRLVGQIKQSPCLVLIDSGSTHNFINPDIVEKFQLPTKAIKPFKVYIGNDDTLGCQHVCPNVKICMFVLTRLIYKFSTLLDQMWYWVSNGSKALEVSLMTTLQ